MYIKSNNANIINVLTVVLILFIIIIFPIFLGVDVCYLNSQKKIFYNIRLFDINIFSGYIEAKKDGIFIHLTKKKAFFIPYKSLFSMRKSIEPIRDYHLIKFNSIIEIQGKSSYNLTMINFIHNYVARQLSWFFYHKKPYFDFYNKIITNENENFNLDIFIDSVVLFNLLMIFMSFIKIIVGKVIYAIRKKTKQNQ